MSIFVSRFLTEHFLRCGVFRQGSLPAPFSLPPIRLVRLFFSVGTVFFSHNNSAGTVFFSQFQSKFCQPNGYHATIAGLLIVVATGKSKSQVPNRRRLVIQVFHVVISYYAHNCMLLSIVLPMFIKH